MTKGYQRAPHELTRITVSFPPEMMSVLEAIALQNNLSLSRLICIMTIKGAASNAKQFETAKDEHVKISKGAGGDRVH